MDISVYLENGRGTLLLPGNKIPAEGAPPRELKRLLTRFLLLVLLVSAAGCAHYPVNRTLRQFDPQAGYRSGNLNEGDNDELLIMITFSGGGTRAAAFSYGVLESLRETEISIDGRRQRMLDHVDMISGVSGGASRQHTTVYSGSAFLRISRASSSKRTSRVISPRPYSSIPTIGGDFLLVFMTAVISPLNITIRISSTAGPSAICSPIKSP